MEMRTNPDISPDLSAFPYNRAGLEWKLHKQNIFSLQNKANF